MLSTTVDAVKALLKADPSVTPDDRIRIVSVIRNNGAAAAAARPKATVERRVLTRAEVARRFNRSTRFVDGLGNSGALRRVRLPGRTRACGYLVEEVERLMLGEEVARDPS
jgi:hypothetical protein